MKKLLLISVVLNVYLLFLIDMPFGMPFQLGGGRTLNFPEKGVSVDFCSYRDCLRIDRRYALTFSKREEDDIYSRRRDFVIIKPPTVLSWVDLRGNEEVLHYDETSGEVVCKIPGYTIRVTSEWFNREMGIKTEDL